MKAIVQEGYGSPDALQLREIGMPACGDAGVLVEVHAASVNALDWHLLRGGVLALVTALEHIATLALRGRWRASTNLSANVRSSGAFHAAMAVRRTIAAMPNDSRNRARVVSIAARARWGGPASVPGVESCPRSSRPAAGATRGIATLACEQQ